MKLNPIKLVIITFIILTIISCGNKINVNVPQERQIVNLETFAKLYGYARFFYPSYKIANLNWNKFAINGVSKIRYDSSDVQLEKDLQDLFKPIAPAMKIYKTNGHIETYDLANYEDTTLSGLLTWQHLGVYLSERSNIYRSQLVYKDIKTGELGNNIFDKFPLNNEIYKVELDSTLSCMFPLTLYNKMPVTLNHKYKYPIKNPLDFSNSKINGKYNANKKEVMLADVIITWNVFQHFYPYFDVIKVDWEKVLGETLNETLYDKNGDEFYDTLRKMVAKLQDGHGVVFYKRKTPLGGLPIKVAWIENNAVITTTTDTLDFNRGDIIESIDGISAKDLLKQEEQYISGSSRLRKFRALNQFGEGSLGSTAKIILSRNNRIITTQVKRKHEPGSLFFNPISEFNFPALKEIKKGIYYVNLISLDEKTFSENINNLANARGIIFDWRWNGRKSKTKPINTIDIIEHIISSTVMSEKWEIPEIIYPDRKKLTFQESQWSIRPSFPHFKGNIVFIDYPAVVSSGETIMGMVKYYKLGVIVGDTTAGTNGNVNFISLPGGFHIMWTGMKVLKNDGTQLELLGIAPDIFVQRTIKGVIENQDEYLNEAMIILKN